jgi:phage baseplate assembly protein V
MGSALMREFDLAEIDRRISRMIRFGVIADTDYEHARVRVRVGNLMTNWLPWMALRAGADVDWWPPSINEQVLLLAPDGEFNNAVVLGSLYQAKHPAPESDPDVRLLRMKDGATFRYDRAANELTIALPGNAKVKIVGDAAVTARSISLNDGSPVVTTGHICHFTGNPHGDGSSSVRAGK